MTTYTIHDIDRRLAAGERITVGESLALLGLDGTGIDTALPQAWVDRALSITGIYAPGNIVWSYREEHGSQYFGAPVPINGEGARLIALMERRAGWLDR